MNKPFVSVIIPAYNRSKLLIYALNSLLNQDYPKEHYEVIVVDNNSQDNTYEEINSFFNNYKDKINLKYVLETRPGLVYTRHTGAKNAKGSILLYGDDDGYYDSNWISAVAEVYLKYPNIGAVGTRIEIKWDSIPKKWIYKYEWTLGKLSYGKGIMVKEEDMYINGGSFSIKKNLLFEVNGFNIGQVGQYLLGDCEAGLCRKLHKNRIPIGFTDKTTMWHIQFVNIQGTLKDIKRRFVNNGISDAYNELFILKESSTKKKKNYLVKARIKLFLNTILFWNKAKRIALYLNIAKYKAYLRYKVLYVTDKNLINKINKKDWILNEKYHYPEPKIENIYKKS